MARLALVAALFFLLIKAAFGAGLGEFTLDKEFSAKIDAQLEAVVPQQQDYASVYAFTAEFKTQVSRLDKLVSSKYKITQEEKDGLPQQVLSVLLTDQENFAQFVTGFKRCNDEELLAAIGQNLKMVEAMGQSSQSGQGGGDLAGLLQKIILGEEVDYSALGLSADQVKLMKAFSAIINGEDYSALGLGTKEAKVAKAFYDAIESGNLEDMSAYTTAVSEYLGLGDVQQITDAETEYSKNKAQYVRILNNLKGINADLENKQGGGAMAYMKFLETLAQDLFK
jgi:hypothetical protein